MSGSISNIIKKRKLIVELCIQKCKSICYRKEEKEEIVPIVENNSE
jgi:hypothetical protein